MRKQILIKIKSILLKLLLVCILYSLFTGYYWYKFFTDDLPFYPTGPGSIRDVFLFISALLLFPIIFNIIGNGLYKLEDYEQNN